MPVHPPTNAPDSIHAERQFGRREHALFFLVPIGVTLLLYFLLRVFVDVDYANQMAYAAGLSVFGFGTTVILGAAVMGDDGFARLGTSDLFYLVVYVGTALAFVYVYSLDLFEMFPGIGPRLKAARANALGTVRSRPWIRRWATIGVALFVLSPLPGSGALGGALVGRLVGLTRMRAFLSVTIANFLVGLLYTSFSGGIRDWVKHHEITPLEKIGGLLLVVVLFAAILKWLNSLGARTPSSESGAPPSA
jgi:hypothetical protein